MTINLKTGTLPVLAVTVILVLIIFLLPDTVIRLVLGIPFLLFSPGYVFTLALFPRKENLSRIERLMWSFGFSIVIVSLIGLILNYVSFGVTLYSTTISVTSFIFIMSAIVVYRLKKLPDSERFALILTVSSPWKDKTRLDRIVMAFLSVAILASVIVIGYRIVTPNAADKFTDTYLLNAEGIAADYPESVTAGEESVVIIGITNSEHREVTYRLVVLVDGIIQSTLESITLGHGDTWQNPVTFSIGEIGENQQVEFAVFEAGADEPVTTPLHLWIDVTGP